MAPILTGQPMVPFAPADPKVENGNTRIVPDCGSVSRCEAALEEAGFRHSVVTVDSDRAEGEFAGLSPASGTRAPQDQVVTIQVSNGSGFQEPPPAREGGGNGGGGNAGGGNGGGGGNAG